jgi:hypothetical protein
VRKLPVRAALPYKLCAKRGMDRKSIVGTEVSWISYSSVGFGWLGNCQIFLTNERNGYGEIKRLHAKSKGKGQKAKVHSEAKPLFFLIQNIRKNRRRK